MTGVLTANRYTYVNGDPINYWDPTGHVPWECYSSSNEYCTRQDDGSFAPQEMRPRSAGASEACRGYEALCYPDEFFEEGPPGVCITGRTDDGGCHGGFLVPECANIKFTGKPPLFLSTDVPGCDALVNDLPGGLCSRLDEDCDPFAWAERYGDDVARVASYIGGACAAAGNAPCTLIAGEVALAAMAVHASAVCDENTPECRAAVRDASLDAFGAGAGARFPFGAAYFGAAWQVFVDLTQPSVPSNRPAENRPRSCSYDSPTHEMGGSGCYG